MSEQTHKVNRQKRIVRFLSSTVDFIVLLILLILLAFASYALWDSHTFYIEAGAAQYETYKPKADDTMPFDELRKINPDVTGWLTVYGTGIDYPVVRSPQSNDDYLSRNAKGEVEGSGSIFLDSHNSADFSDFNTIIFGHHMSSHAMFGDIDLFTSQSFFNEHEHGNLFYNGTDHGVDFFAFIKADAYDSSLYSPALQGREAQQNYLNYIWQNAEYTRSMNVTPDDHIVLLSTCSQDVTNGRYVLVGKITNETYADPYAEEAAANKKSNFDFFSVISRVGKLPVWLWIAILILLIALVSLELHRLKKKREKARKERDSR